jgi:hypothetical protein
MDDPNGRFIAVKTSQDARTKEFNLNFLRAKGENGSWLLVSCLMAEGLGALP